MTFRSIARRDLLKIAAAHGLLACTGVAGRAWGSKTFGTNPFSLGVASGDPWPDGFVLWTRLAPNPLEIGSGMPAAVVPVDWEVAEDDRFTRIARSGVAQARPELGHSVHVEVSGLKPARPYWYRFRAAGELSRIGTARTSPAAGAAVDRVRIGVAGCQHYEQGLYTAYRHLSEVAELDAVFHYGDYIYEGSGRRCEKEGVTPPCVRRHLGEEIYSLDEYRRRYAQYKLDADLQSAHAAAPFLMSYDDHEVDNNWSADRDQDGTPAEVFVLRRFAAMQAWYENMPVRQAQFPTPGGLRMHRRLDFGDLVRVHVLDTRQYRGGQLPSERERLNEQPTAASPAPVTMLGPEQERWLAEGLSRSARWNLLAQQVMLMPFRYPAGRINRDSWSGYSEARARLTRQIHEQDLHNVVIATGDVHKHHAGAVPLREGDLEGPAAATEFVCSSISSDGDGADLAKGWEHMPADNPHCQLFNARRGYQVFDIGRDRWRTDVWVVDQVTKPAGQVSRLTSFTVEHNRVALHESS